jgi:hypothetical protein
MPRPTQPDRRVTAKQQHQEPKKQLTPWQGEQGSRPLQIQWNNLLRLTSKTVKEAGSCHGLPTSLLGNNATAATPLLITDPPQDVRIEQNALKQCSWWWKGMQGKKRQ